MSTTIDVTNTAVFKRPKSQVRTYCREYIPYLMRDDITHGCASTEPPSPGWDLGPSVRAPRSEVLRDNAQTQRTALLQRRRPR
jgi:hypothetical protein